MKQRYAYSILIFLCLAFLNALAGPTANLASRGRMAAQSSIQLEPVLSGLSSSVHVTNAADGTNRLFVVEQGGTIRVVQPGAMTSTIFLDITTRVLSGGERGLLGLAFHPYYKNNGRFFVYYTRQTDGALQVAEYHVSAANPNVADTAEIIILTIPHPGQTNHNGGTIAFGPDGYLYIAPGDGGSGNDPPNNAQNINQLLGKVLRIDVDHANGAVPYSSPPSNPFFGSTPGSDEIYAVGMRNPYRFSFDRATGQLYVGDVGQGAWEEIDIITLGGNYGWRVFEGMHCTGNDPGLCNSDSPCSINGYTCPIAEYSSASPSPRCSITGGYVYRGPAGTFPTGAYIYGDFCTGEIFMLNGGTQSLSLDTSLNISSFGEDGAGELYVVGLGGSVNRIVNPNASCSFLINPTEQSFSSTGGTGNVIVAAPFNCGWAATSNDSWVSITSADGSGYGPVAYSVMANTSGMARTTTMTVAGQTFTVLQGASFADVAPNNQFFTFIGKLSAREVTVGCGSNAQGQRLYCPSDFVTREQMAAFIIRALGMPNPPTPAQQRFADVHPSNPFYAFIEEMAARGITQGCGTNAQGQPIFCPADFVTREQMAAFIMRALGESNPPSPPSQMFQDVPPSNLFFRFIDRMTVRGITSGCGTNAQGQLVYCPGDFVTREQMAAFLVRAFGL